MEVHQRPARTEGFRFSIDEDGREVARAFLCLAENDLHSGRWFGLLEDVFVDGGGRGFGVAIVGHVMAEARHRGFYKLIATSRHERSRVHDLYRSLGFEEWGREFRLNLGAPHD